MSVCWSDRGRWNETEAIIGAGSINVADLQPAQRYVFRVVAMNGVDDIVRKTRSDHKTITIRQGNVFACIITSQITLHA